MTQVFVSEDASGNITGLFANQQSFPVVAIDDQDPRVVAFLNPPKPQTVLSQDIMSQLTAADATAIQAAIAGNVQFWLLWNAMTAQKDPMVVTNARFVAGWGALVQVLGQPRMSAIATALGLTSLVV